MAVGGFARNTVPIAQYEKLAQAARVARSARLHPARQSGRLPDRHQVHQRPDQERHRRASRDRSVQRGRQAVSGRLVGGEDGAGIQAARARHVRAAGSSERLPVPRRSADSAVRQCRLDAGLSDGRQVRSHPRWLRRGVRSGHDDSEAGGGQGHRGRRCGRLRGAAPPERRLHRRQSPAQGERGSVLRCRSHLAKRRRHRRHLHHRQAHDQCDPGKGGCRSRIELHRRHRSGPQAPCTSSPSRASGCGTCTAARCRQDGRAG